MEDLDIAIPARVGRIAAIIDEVRDSAIRHTEARQRLAEELKSGATVSDDEAIKDAMRFIGQLVIGRINREVGR